MSRSSHRTLLRQVILFSCLVLVALPVGTASWGQMTSAQSRLRLVSDEGYDLLSWFPDGETLLLGRQGEVLVESATRAQQLTELWIQPLDGDSLRQMTANGVAPTVSPDGAQVAYLSYSDAEQWSGMVYDLASGQETRHVDEVWSAGARPRWDSPDQVQWAAEEPMAGPRFASPDGRYVAGLDVQPGPATTLWVRDLQTGGERVYVQDERWFLDGLSWAPDGRHIVFSRTAPGAGVDGEVCWLDLDSGSILPLSPGRHPLWSPDGAKIALEYHDRIWLLQIDRGATPQPLGVGDLERLAEVETLDPGPRASSMVGQLMPPATIRVLHSASNYYRSDVPPGQIDIIPFEEYVKRVVPHEVIRTWPTETLKAQAVAARTYAWWFVIRHTDWDYDVNDWTEYQVMGDATYSQTNAAVDATRGQYIAHEGEVILAEFSHQNGSPTLPRYVGGTPPNEDTRFPYLRSVVDPVSFGESRHGHGRGFCQEGGRRWALEPYYWTYEQMLAHYYTDVTIERPANPGPGPVAPVGAVVAPLSGSYVSSRYIALRASVSDGDGDVVRVEYQAHWLDAQGIKRSQSLGPATREFNGWCLQWDVSALPDQACQTDTILVTATATDSGGRATALEGIVLGLDRQLPEGTVSAVPYVEGSTVPLSLAPGAAGASGMAGLLVSNDWLWEGESLYHQNGTGTAVTDPAALNGSAWVGRASLDNPGAWFGPYTRDLPPGRAYRAIFRLKTDVVTDGRTIARLDVVDDAGATLLGLRYVRGIDFRQADTYQEFGVDFWYREESASGLEFRVHYGGLCDLYFDRVLVTVYPLPADPVVMWELPPAPGIYTVQAKYADGAGNVSADQVLTIRQGVDEPTPSLTATATATPTSTPTPTATPPGYASVSLSVGTIFADYNSNIMQEPDEPTLTDVGMRFLSEGGDDVQPPVVGGSWAFDCDVAVGRTYFFVARRPGYQPVIVPIRVTDIGSTVRVNWPALPLRLWSRGALLPLRIQGT